MVFPVAWGVSASAVKTASPISQVSGFAGSVSGSAGRPGRPRPARSPGTGHGLSPPGPLSKSGPRGTASGCTSRWTVSLPAALHGSPSSVVVVIVSGTVAAAPPSATTSQSSAASVASMSV